MDRLNSIGLSEDEKSLISLLIVKGKVLPSSFENFGDDALATTLRMAITQDQAQNQCKYQTLHRIIQQIVLFLWIFVIFA